METKSFLYSVVKWFFVFVGVSVTLSVAAIIFLAFYFKPLIKIDEKKDQVSLLGGLIELQGDGKMDKVQERAASETSQGYYAPTNDDRPWGVRFNAGRIIAHTNTKVGMEQYFQWKCEFNKPEVIKVQAKTLDLSELDLKQCDVYFPKQSKVVLSGDAGKIEASEPRFELAANLSAGEIVFTPAADAAYQFNNKLMVGKQDEFVSSSAKDAYPIALSVKTGSLEYNK